MDIAIHTTQFQGLVWGLIAVPICLWCVYTDFKEMKIKNVAVLALIALFVVSGPFLLPSMSDYLWRFANFGIVLAVTFVLSATMGLGAGDAKFAAAAALFIAPADAGLVAFLFVVWSLVLLFTMIPAAWVPAFRTAGADWVWFSDAANIDRFWKRRVPFGVGLCPTLASYLVIAAMGPAVGAVDMTNRHNDVRTIEVPAGGSLLPDAPASESLLPPSQD